MADLGLDVDALRRDRDRYQALLAHAEEQISAWNERADSVQQAIGGIDQLLALAGDDGAADGGSARHGLPSRTATGARGGDRPAPSRGAVSKRKAPPPKRPAPGPTPSPAAAPAPSADDPDGAVAADAPKGTDAVRAILSEDPGRSFTLAELLGELEERQWLAPSRRPEELVRINLKRLAERGGAVRTEDGRWRAPAEADAEAEADADGADDVAAAASPAAAGAAEEGPSPEPTSEPPAPPAPTGGPGGGTSTDPPIAGSNARDW